MERERFAYGIYSLSYNQLTANQKFVVDAAVNAHLSTLDTAGLVEALENAKEVLEKIQPATTLDRAYIYSALRIIYQVLDPIANAAIAAQHKGGEHE